jgi:hypothetical protein
LQKPRQVQLFDPDNADDTASDPDSIDSEDGDFVAHSNATGKKEVRLRYVIFSTYTRIHTASSKIFFPDLMSKHSCGPLRQEERALCRVMYDHGVSVEEIARMMARTVHCIGRTIRNDYQSPDNMDRDYALLSDGMKKKYPRLVDSFLVSRYSYNDTKLDASQAGPRLSGPKLKRGRESAEDDHVVKHRRTEVSNSLSVITSRAHYRTGTDIGRYTSTSSNLRVKSHKSK